MEVKCSESPNGMHAVGSDPIPHCRYCGQPLVSSR